MTAGALVLGALVACSDQLVVPNQNNPDQAQALQRPVDVEALISSSYNAHHAAAYHSTEALQPGMQVLGLLSYSNLANFNMGVRAAVPRGPIANYRGNTGAGQNLQDWNGLHRAARQAALGLAEVLKPTFFFLPTSNARNARARAFAYYVIGISVGSVAMVYDSGMAISPLDDLDTLNVLLPYDQLSAYAVTMLDSAIANATLTPTGANGFPLPATWLNTAGGGTVSAANFIALCRAWQSRIRVNVLRSPAEANAITPAVWTDIRDDALAGAAAWPTTGGLTAPTSGQTIASSPSAGWNVQWFAQHFASNSQNWHQAWPYMLGMADTSGNYAAWLATPAANRLPFLIVTPDRRLPQGTTRGAQQGDSTRIRTNPPTLYYRNRQTSLDWTGSPLGTGYYDQYRWYTFQTSSPARTGPFPVFTTAEMNMIAAEADIHLADYTGAATLINITRQGNGNLPAATATAPGVAIGVLPGCVPKVPVGPAFTTVACGDIMEAMKWEKRQETAFTNYGSWYFDGRRWGDLAEGTPLSYPVPYNEMDVRLQPFYDLGGVGQPTGAPRGNYGI